MTTPGSRTEIEESESIAFVVGKRLWRLPDDESHQSEALIGIQSGGGGASCAYLNRLSLSHPVERRLFCKQTLWLPSNRRFERLVVWDHRGYRSVSTPRGSSP
jgi:hypothetical protein